MGYYTDHSLEVKHIASEDCFDDLVAALDNMGIIDYAIDHGHYDEKTKSAYFYSVGSVKWYSHPEDMTKISKEFPEMTFMLDGCGEDFGDFWHDYFHNGECESCRGNIVYEEPKKIKWE